MSDLLTRRSLIKTHVNPNQAHDYLSDLMLEQASLSVAIRYVPDKHLVQLGDLEEYFASLFATPNPLLETLAGTLLDDFNNELIPRWIQITLSHTNHHRVTLEDRQPNWDNPYLINRLHAI